MKSLATAMVLFLGTISYAQTTTVLNPYKMKFLFPVDSKKIEITSIRLSQADIMLDEVQVSCPVGSDLSVCYDRQWTSEPAIEIRMKYVSYEGVVGDETSSQREVTTYLKLIQLAPDVVKNIPKVNFTGNGQKANQKYANTILKINRELVVRDVSVVDEQRSTFCPQEIRDAFPCDEKIVYKLGKAQNTLVTLFLQPGSTN